MRGGKLQEDGNKMHNEKLYNSYSSPNIIMMLKSRRIRWAGTRDMINAYKASVKKTKGRLPSESMRT
jgi:hypothetical protein